MQGAYLMFDAAYPPSKPYPGAHVAAGYLGGNTPHVWSRQQWNQANGNGLIRSLGIWTGYLEADPYGHADMAADAAIALGWAHNLSRYIVNDKETQEDRAWCSLFAARLAFRGFLTLEYRSLSAILADPTPPNADNWSADWGAAVNFGVAPRDQAFQMRANVPWAGTNVDLSLITPLCYDRCGRGLRR